MLFVIWLSVTACETDNYGAPDAEIYGSVINDMTNKPIQTEQPNGFRISLTQVGYTNDPVPLYFWGKADGTFENTKVFSGNYKVIPVEGAFFSPDTQEVNIEGRVQVDFEVTPFLTIEIQDSASYSSDANGVVVRYSIDRSQVSGKILNRQTLASVSPNVSQSIFDESITHDLSGTDDNTVLSTQFADTVRGLEAGETYYIRVAAIADNALNRYNYSPIMEVSIP